MMVEAKSDLKYDFIETQENLEKIVSKLESEQTLGLDTEGTKFDPFTAKLLLIQLSTKDKTYVIDVTKVN